MLSLDEILGVANQGMTKPFLCKGSDGKIYYAKGKGATPSGLIKEWMAANLAQAFGLPIPTFHIAYIDSQLVNYFGDDAIDNLGAGEVFVSQQVESASEFRYSMLNKVAVELQRDILIFDLWIENADRTLSEISGNPNLLWGKSTNQLYIIDHNLAFDNDFSLQGSWDLHPFVKNIQLDIQEREELEERLIKSLHGWSRWWNQIPDEWKQQNKDSMIFDENRTLERLKAESQGDIWSKLL